MNRDIADLLEQMHEWQRGLAERDIVALTTDIDWASEPAIQETASFFLERRMPLTIYCTHPSQCIERLKGDPLVHLGIHPNFAPDSSQGASPTQVMEYLMRLHPEAVTMRCHRWSGSNDIYDLMLKAGILFDSNQISLGDPLPPYVHRSGLLTFPAFWEDGAWLWHDLPLEYGKREDEIFSQKGLKVVNFHPMHFVMNTPHFRWMRDLKDSLSRQEYSAFSVETIARRRWQGKGIRHFLLDALEAAKARGATFALLSDLYYESPLAGLKARYTSDLAFSAKRRKG